MFSNSLFFSRIVALGAISSLLFGATPVIGIVTASGHFMLEKSEVWGNSSLFDGSVIETSQASSDMALRNGVKVQLGAKSRARVFENRLALEKGAGQFSAAVPYEFDAAGLKITGERVRVSLTDRVEVVALAGPARVIGGSGQLLASIPAGRSMDFAMQAGQTGAVTRTGCLLYKDGRFILQDENTQEVAELTGNVNFAQNVGNRVQASGTATGARPATAAASVVMNVTALSSRSQGGCLSVASALDAKTEAPAGAGPTSTAAAKPTPAPSSGGGGGGGMSTGAKIAIVGAIAGGGAGAALALAGKKSSSSP